MNNPVKPSNRRRARSLALQAIYQWQLSRETVANIYAQFMEKLNAKKVDIEYFHSLLEGVINHITTLDQEIAPLLDRKLGDLDMVEIAALRIATYEIKYRSDVPHKVVINEALELTKTFGSSDGYRYINGVLDNLIKTSPPK